MPDMPRILLVDDDPDISLALGDYLQQENYHVEIVDTGNAAIEKGLGCHYDAVLLDVGLPDRDGVEVLGELARHRPELPIILLTAFTSLDKCTNPEILNKAFAYLTKPYQREEIRQVLRRAVFGAKKSGSQRMMRSAIDEHFIHFPSILQPSPTSRPKVEGPRYQLFLDAYQRLAENVQLMQFAFDQVPEAILVADADKRFRFANQAAYNILGYSKEELEALRIPDIAPNHDNQRYEEHLNELRQGKTLSYYTTHLTKDFRTIPVEISVYLLNFQGQEFTCAVTKDMPSQPVTSESSVTENRW